MNARTILFAILLMICSSTARGAGSRFMGLLEDSFAAPDDRLSSQSSAAGMDLDGAIGELTQAAGPQFTALWNVYAPSSSNFNKTSNSLARIDLGGPIAGTVVPLSGNWSDIVVPPDNHAWYTITSGSVYKIDPGTRVATEMLINVTLPPNESLGWNTGATWDTARNRLVVSTLSGTGFFFGYSNDTNQWTIIADLRQLDLRAIAYRPANGLIYAIKHDQSITQLLKYNANGQAAGTVNLSLALSSNSNLELDWQMTVASDGQIAVLKPALIPSPAGGLVAGNWLYLINPDTGQVTYSGPIPIPEPGFSIILLITAALMRRRTRFAGRCA